MFQFIVFVLTISCVFSATQVFSCDDGEYVDGTKCRVCPLHCTKCTSSSVCTACQDAYFLYGVDNTCELKTLITIDNCIDIADKAAATKVCSKCADRYWLKSDKTCVAVALTTCLTWSSDVAEEACVTFDCTKVHEKCTECSSATVCTECDYGYFLSAPKVCTEATGNCLTWKKQETEECESCPTGYTIIDIKFCIASQCLYSANNRIVCYSRNARSSAPFCNVSCSDNNCVDCADDTANTCLECDYSFSLKAGACVEKTLLSGCLEVSSDDDTKCLKCQSQYTVVSGSCIYNIANCTEMADKTSCKICEDGYYLTTDSPALCAMCDDNCKCSDSSAKCTSCKDWFFYDDSGETPNCDTWCEDDDCLQCSAPGLGKCTKCQESYVKNDNGTCTNADCLDRHCLVCGKFGKSCTECWNNYYLDTTESAEEAICVRCTVENAKYVKTSCSDTQRIKFPWTCTDLTGNCAENRPTPLIGEEVQSCKTCIHGFKFEYKEIYPDGYISTCTACPDHCYQCDDDVSKCAECYVGYYLKDDDKTCVACDATTCQKCSETECLDCKPKYGFKSTPNQACEECSELNEAKTACTPCQSTCANCLDGSTCYVCKEGNYLDNKVCKPCFENCKLCTSATACTECMTGFELNNNKTACNICEDGNYGDGEVCKPCFENCKLCTSATACTECMTGFEFNSGKTACICEDGNYVDGEVCKPCFENCKLCTSATACTECMTGFEFNSGKTACICKDGNYVDNEVCKPCFENCKLCTSATACTECLSGFEFNNEKTACTKSTTTSSGTGRECLETVSGCMKCDATTSTNCELCESGSAPIDGKCTCDSGKLLIGGVCIEQSTAELPEDYTDKTLDDLKPYVTKALASDNKTKITKEILGKTKTILDDDKTNENAGKSLQLLLQFADAASEAQESYSAIITTACGITELSQTNYQIALAAADKVMQNATDKKGMYQLGQDCLANLLKNVDSPSDISLKMNNSEFTMQKFTKADKDKKLELTGVTATMNEDFLTAVAAVGDGDFYATFQAIPNTVNPYASEQTNTKFKLSSKIVSFSVRTSTEVKEVKLDTNKTFTLEFDAAGTQGKCSYYDKKHKKWIQDGTLTDKSCAFSHLTDFAIYQDTTTDSETSTDVNEEEKACMLQVLSILLIFIVAMV